MSADHHSSRHLRAATIAVWMPWLAAPLFCLLPIGGCAVAGSMRHAAARVDTAATAPLPGPAMAGARPPAAIAPILTVSSR
jgi:hypothetical protein